MARELSNEFKRYLEKSSLEPFYAIEIDLPDSGTQLNLVRVWTGYGILDVGGEDYQGLNTILSIGSIVETMQIQATGADFSLSGVPSDIIGTMLDGTIQGSPITIQIGMIDNSVTPTVGQDVNGNIITTTRKAVDSPYTLFKGRLDAVTIQDNGNTSAVRITCESRLIDLERARVRRYTPQDQKAKFPTDRGFDFVSQIVEKQIVWGRA